MRYGYFRMIDDGMTSLILAGVVFLLCFLGFFCFVSWLDIAGVSMRF